MTLAEIEAQLSQAAERLRELQKAAKDQAAKATAEPADNVRTSIGDIQPTRPPTVPPR